jgi:hypothetical protein
LSGAVTCQFCPEANLMITQSPRSFCGHAHDWEWQLQGGLARDGDVQATA